MMECLGKSLTTEYLAEMANPAESVHKESTQ